MQKTGGVKHLRGEEWPANYDSLKRCRNLTDQNLGRADIALFFGHHDLDDDPKFGSATSYGAACAGEKQNKCQLDMWWTDPSVTAGFVTEMIGINLGMRWDDIAAHQGKGCNGIMGYGGDRPMEWSACSRADFEAHYLKYKDQWCMPKSEKACNDEA